MKKAISIIIAVLFILNVAFCIASSNIPSELKSEYKYGGQDKTIIAVKERLQELGYFSPSALFSATIGSSLKDAVKEFQKTNGLKQDGKLNTDLFNVLFSSGAKKSSKTWTDNYDYKVSDDKVAVFYSFDKDEYEQESFVTVNYLIKAMPGYSYSNVAASVKATCNICDSYQNIVSSEEKYLDQSSGKFTYYLSEGASSYILFFITAQNGTFTYFRSNSVNISNDKSESPILQNSKRYNTTASNTIAPRATEIPNSNPTQKTFHTPSAQPSAPKNNLAAPIMYFATVIFVFVMYKSTKARKAVVKALRFMFHLSLLPFILTKNAISLKIKVRRILRNYYRVAMSGEIDKYFKYKTQQDEDELFAVFIYIIKYLSRNGYLDRTTLYKHYSSTISDNLIIVMKSLGLVKPVTNMEFVCSITADDMERLQNLRKRYNFANKNPWINSLTANINDKRGTPDAPDSQRQPQYTKEEAPANTTDTDDAWLALESQRQALDHREKYISERENKLKEIESTITQGQAQLNKERKEYIDKKSELENKEKDLTMREYALSQKEQKLADSKMAKKQSHTPDKGDLAMLQKSLEDRECYLDVRERQLTIQQNDLDLDKELVKHDKADIEKRKKQLDQRELALSNREAAVISAESEINRRLTELDAKEAQIKTSANTKNALNDWTMQNNSTARATLLLSQNKGNAQDELNIQKKLLQRKENELTDRENQIKAKQQQLAGQELDLSQREAVVSEQVKSVNERQCSLSIKEDSLQKKTEAMSIRERSLDARDKELINKNTLLNQREKTLDDKSAEIDKKQSSLTEREKALKDGMAKLAEEQQALARTRSDDRSYQTRMAYLEKKGNELASQEARLSAKEKELRERSDMLKKQQNDLADRENALKKKLAEQERIRNASIVPDSTISSFWNRLSSNIGAAQQQMDLPSTSGASQTHMSDIQPSQNTAPADLFSTLSRQSSVADGSLLGSLTQKSINGNYQEYPFADEEESDNQVNLILQDSPTTITNSIFTLSFRQIKPCSSTSPAREYIIRFQEPQTGIVISDEKTIVTSLTAANGMDEPVKLIFQLENREYTKNGEYWMVIIDKELGKIIKKDIFKINLLINMNFDF